MQVKRRQSKEPTKPKKGESGMTTTTPIPEDFKLLHRYWQASNYLSVGQIYLLDKNPLLDRPLEPDDVKTRLLGHFGTTSGQNFIYTHLNRIIKDREIKMIYISGPGHGGPALVSHVYLEGTYSKYYPHITMDKCGLGKLFKQFSFPGGIPSHVAPETPGSIHEGGELGYSLSHAYGAVLDKPDLTVACIVGDGEAETGPMATSWHSNKFLNPATDGTVLPILHLNGFKIANPCVLARIPESELLDLFKGYGYDPIVVSGDDPAKMHPEFSRALDEALDKIQVIREKARAEADSGKTPARPCWPMVVLRSPKGWTGPKTVDREMIEDSWRSHQVPVNSPSQNPEHLKVLEDWLRSYEPDKIFDADGKLKPELQALAPPPHLCMGDNPYTNPTVRPLIVPDFGPFGIRVDPNDRGSAQASDTFTTGQFLREVFKANERTKNFRLFGPDETASNRLQAVFDETKKTWMGEYTDKGGNDDLLSPTGRVMEMLSEHQCEGWLEGYLLTGGHGLLNSYEAFIHIISSMFNQHAKWLKITSEIPWRNKLSSLNMLLASHVWRQDHNGFTHQDPGFLQHVATKKPGVVRIYLPPDANSLLSCMHHCLQSKHYVNVMVAGKHPAPQWLTVEEARQHCSAGAGIWEWASNDFGREPDLVIACAGDVPTLEALAATTILRKKLPDLSVRFVNVVDLMKLDPNHPHGLKDETFDAIFTTDKPVLFNFHAYPQMVEKLTYHRKNRNFVVRGYIEEGTISTPFDICVMNRIDRFHLVVDVCDLVENKCAHVGEKTRWTTAYVRQEMKSTLVRHKQYIHEYGVDMDEIQNWKWNA
uniref:Phosphoketolase n=1 Tax=Amphora coffeiformis TaxID=265554 RepID=A0A7S3KYB1_9STRA